MQKPQVKHQPKIFVDQSRAEDTPNGTPVRVNQRTELMPREDHQYELAQMKNELHQMMEENQMALNVIRSGFANPQSLLVTAERLFDDVTNSVTFVEEIEFYWE